MPRRSTRARARISRSRHSGADPALRHAAAEPSLHGRHTREAAGRAGRTEKSRRQRGAQHLRPAALVEAGRMAASLRAALAAKRMPWGSQRVQWYDGAGLPRHTELHKDRFRNRRGVSIRGVQWLSTLRRFPLLAAMALNRPALNRMPADLKTDRFDGIIFSLPIASLAKLNTSASSSAYWPKFSLQSRAMSSASKISCPRAARA